MQVFFWVGPGTARDNKTFYDSFALNGVNYKIGECAEIDLPAQKRTFYWIALVFLITKFSEKAVRAISSSNYALILYICPYVICTVLMPNPDGRGGGARSWFCAGDSIYLYPEDESHPNYIGRIVSAFVDEHSGHADPHCIEVKWYERRVNLEANTKGIEESEREVFELEDTDINPIGCCAGKTIIVKAKSYEEVSRYNTSKQARQSKP